MRNYCLVVFVLGSALSVCFASHERETRGIYTKNFFGGVWGNRPPLMEVNQPKTSCTCKCGERNEAGRIVGGDEAAINEFPWMARLTYFKRFYCGGMLINDRYVLTAAHCVKGFMWFMIKVTFGEHNRCNATQRPETRFVLRAIANNFSFTNFDNDIALLRLNERVPISEVIKPICLPPDDSSLYVSMKAVASGWGTLTEEGKVSCTLQEVEVPVISNQECRGTKYSPSMITDNMLCAGYPKTGQKDSCQGDSGGPLITERKRDNRYELIGVVSWGNGCARVGYPGVYTRVTKYLEWIKTNTQDACYYGKCSWDIRQLSPIHPILITNSQPRQLYHPTGRYIALASGDSLLVECNGQRNYVIYTRNDPGRGRVTEQITCVNNYNVRVGGQTVDVKHLRCAAELADEVHSTNTRCGVAAAGRELIIGFRTSLGNFQSLKVCYDFTRNTPLYSENILRGNSIYGRFRDQITRQFMVAGVQGDDGFWKGVYYGKDQRKMLNTALGTGPTGQYMADNNYMNRGHLTPRSDNIFHYTQKATYFYANVVPQWRTINSGSWEQIERAVRDLAANLRQDLKVYTGVYESLQLLNSRNTNVNIVLGSTSQPVTVPKFVWKLVCNATNACISYVSLNNPRGTVQDKICDDISANNIWWNVNDLKEGRGACCDPNQLFQNMRMTLPQTIGSSNLGCNI